MTDMRADGTAGNGHSGRLLALAVVLTAGSAWLLWGDRVPLGVLGEWVWNRSPNRPGLMDFPLPGLVTAGYILLVLFGRKILKDRRERWTLVLLPALTLCGAALQSAWLDLPRSGLGLERAASSLYFPVTSGYFWHARTIDDPAAFVRDYEEWISTQDPFHIGTHPPGLFLLNRGLLAIFRDRPKLSKALLRQMPARLKAGFEPIRERSKLSVGEQASLFAVALLTWTLGLLTLLPVYAIARVGSRPSAAWLAAALWPIVPAGIVFVPLADCLYPFFSTSVVALTLWSSRSRVWLLALVAGAMLWIGMMMSLAFLAVVPIALGALTLSTIASYGRVGKKTSLWSWLVAVTAIATGFGGMCEWVWHQWEVNLYHVWSLNLLKHSDFYSAMPRSYWPWVGVNLVEFAIVTGLPVFLLACIGCFRRQSWPDVIGQHAITWCWVATVILVDLSGRNLSEVGRLWIFLTPFACVGAANALDADEPTATLLGCWLTCQAAAGLILIATVEPLLPTAIS